MGLQLISARQVGAAPTRIRFDFRPGGTVSYQKNGTDTEASFKQALVDDLIQRGLDHLMPPLRAGPHEGDANAHCQDEPVGLKR